MSGNFLSPNGMQQAKKSSLSAASSGGSAVPKKVPLQKGRSLMDWVRLTNSSADLSGTAGKMLKVTEDDMRKHSTEKDAWMIINGDVYNVTAYLEYHPGGVEELMRGVGTDGTSLFNEIHAWVNYDSMLKTCLVGRFTGNRSKLSKPLSAAVSKTDQSVSRMADCDWLLTEDMSDNGLLCTLTLTPIKGVCTAAELVDADRKKLRVLIREECNNYEITIPLPQSVVTDSLKVRQRDKLVQIQLAFNKRAPSLKNYYQNESVIRKLSDAERCYRSCVVQSKEQITHACIHFTVQLPCDTFFFVPVGHHVHLKYRISERSTITRAYTPVCKDLLGTNKHKHDSQHIHLLIKIYGDGQLTPSIAALKHGCLDWALILIGDRVQVSDVTGSFNIQHLHDSSQLVCLAAGTGITPMLNVLCSYWQTTHKRSRPLLLYFNKTPLDVIWARELQDCVADDLLRLEHIYSQDNSEGVGRRVSERVLKDALPRPQSGLLICVCGPDAFTQTCIRLLTDLKYTSEQVHVFQG